MKTHLKLAVLAVLLVATAIRCFAMMSIGDVSKAQAKEMGMEVRVTPAGLDAVRVELEFETKGALKNYSRVDLEISDGKLSVSASLQEEGLRPRHVLVSFAADRAHLDKITLRVVTGVPMNMVGLDLHMKDFVDLDKLR